MTAASSSLLQEPTRSSELLAKDGVEHAETPCLPEDERAGSHPTSVTSKKSGEYSLRHGCHFKGLPFQISARMNKADAATLAAMRTWFQAVQAGT